MAPFKRRPPRLRGFDYRAERTYFVTICTWQRRRSFELPLVAAAAATVILDLRAKGRYYLFAYCVMPDHLHLLLKLCSGVGSLPTIIGCIKAMIRHRVRTLTDVTWMPGFYERIKRDYEECSEFVNYILQNPVRAGIVQSPADYPFMGRPDSYM